MYHLEHWLAWVAALVAVGLAAAALLRGFGIIETGDGVTFDTATDEQGAAVGGSIADALVLMLPAISAAILSFAMHSNDHHRSRYPDYKPQGVQALWAGEHFFAMIFGVVAISLGVAGILVGYDVFNRGNDQADGILWSLAGIGAAVLSTTLHSVRHHQVATDEDYLREIVEGHVHDTVTTPPTTTERVPEGRFRR
jgi:hypothetical protein